MDVIRFRNPTAPTKMEWGEIVNGIKDKQWIERYAEAGEFTFKSTVGSGLKELLPIGTFVSHTNTTELMLVENHEINASEGGEAEITVTGRSFETVLDRRVVGENVTMPATWGAGLQDFVLAAVNFAYDTKDLIEQHILSAFVIRPGEAIPWVHVTEIVPLGGSSGTGYKQIPSQDLYTAVIDLLKVDTLGIKSIRPMAGHFPIGDIELQIHKGVDRRASLFFSYDAGEIVSADYLWSDKTLKNGAMVLGTWQKAYVGSGATGIDRRIMYVEAKDVDSSYTAIPAGPDIDTINAALQLRGIQELKKQKPTIMTKAEASKAGLRSHYREDFDVGDVVTVFGDYNESTVMRITEYVEIEDDTGDHGYPTLTALQDDIVPE